MKTENMIIPQNLLEVIKNNLPGYQLVFGYAIERVVSVAGYSPAVSETLGQKQVQVFSNDLSVIEDIWKLLDHEKSKLTKYLFYANFQENIFFEVADGVVNGSRNLPSDPFITREMFDELQSIEGHTFRWGNTIISATEKFANKESFHQFIEQKIAEEKQNLE